MGQFSAEKLSGGNYSWRGKHPRGNYPRGGGGGAIFLEGNCPITDFKEQRPGADILLPTFVPCGN